MGSKRHIEIFRKDRTYTVRWDAGLGTWVARQAEIWTEHPVPLHYVDVAADALEMLRAGNSAAAVAVLLRELPEEYSEPRKRSEGVGL